MGKLNGKALALAAASAVMLTSLFFLAGGNSDDDPSWPSVIPTALLTFLAVLGVGYQILRDAVERSRVAIVSREDFGLPYGRVVALSAVLMLVVGFAGSIAGSVAAFVLTVVNAGFSDESMSDESQLVLAAMWATVFLLAGSYYIGRWIGYRSRERAIVGVVAAIVIARAVAIVIGMSTLGYEKYAEMMTGLGVEAWQYLIELAVLVTTGIIGVWRGKRIRPAYYLHYVLRKISKEESRDVLLELAYAEATRLKDA